MAVAAEADPNTTSPSAFAATSGERAVAAVVISVPFAGLVGGMTAYSVGVTAGVLTGVLVGAALVAYVARFLAGGAAPTPRHSTYARGRPAPFVEPTSLGELPASPSTAGERTCAACGTRFVAARVNQRYCGHDCRRRAAAARRRALSRR